MFREPVIGDAVRLKPERVGIGVHGDGDVVRPSRCRDGGRGVNRGSRRILRGRWPMDQRGRGHQDRRGRCSEEKFI